MYTMVLAYLLCAAARILSYPSWFCLHVIVGICCVFRHGLSAELKPFDYCVCFQSVSSILLCFFYLFI
jgi:hypothetical protein